MRQSCSSHQTRKNLAFHNLFFFLPIREWWKNPLHPCNYMFLFGFQKNTPRTQRLLAKKETLRS